MEAAGFAPLNLVVRLWHAPAHALMQGFSLGGRLMFSALLWLLFPAGGAFTAATSRTSIKSGEERRRCSLFLCRFLAESSKVWSK